MHADSSPLPDIMGSDNPGLRQKSPAAVTCSRNFQNGLLRCSIFFHQLDADVYRSRTLVANFLGGAVIAIQHFAVLRIQAQCGFLRRSSG